jgi:plasmid stabilization system protein ParE
MADVVVRPEASADIAGIYAQGANEFEIEVADRYHVGLQATIERLAAFPQSGPVYPGIRPAVRYLSYRRHHIFYDFDGTTVWVIRILHHAQDAGRLL